MKCMFVPLKYTDCTTSLQFIMALIILTIKCLQSKQKLSGCVLTSSPPEVLTSKAIFRSAVNALHSYDLLLCFGFPQPLSTHCTTHGYFLYVVIYTYNHVPGTNYVSIFMKYVRGDRKCVTSLGSYVNTYCHMPPDHYRSLLTFQFCS